MRPLRLMTATATALMLASSSLFVSANQASADVAATSVPAVTSVFTKPGDKSEETRQVQNWLKGLSLLSAEQVTGIYDEATTAAVKQFQKEQGLPQTGVVDNVTQERLSGRAKAAATTTGKPPVKKVVRKIATPIPKPKPKPVVTDVQRYGLDSRCDDEAKVLCADQSRRKVWYLENGKVVKQFDARFGASSTPTRNGKWRIFRKVKNEVSYLYNMVPMPYSMYFSGGEAFHYSADFARVGWNNSRGGSHGCINIRDYSGLAWVYNRVPVGTLTIVTN